MPLISSCCCLFHIFLHAVHVVKKLFHLLLSKTFWQDLFHLGEILHHDLFTSLARSVKTSFFRRASHGTLCRSISPFSTIRFTTLEAVDRVISKQLSRSFWNTSSLLSVLSEIYPIIHAFAPVTLSIFFLFGAFSIHRWIWCDRDPYIVADVIFLHITPPSQNIVYYKAKNVCCQTVWQQTFSIFFENFCSICYILFSCYKPLCFFQILPVHTDRILIQFLCIYISRHSMSIETSYSCALIRACCMCFIPNLIIRKYITDTIVLCHICPLINCFPLNTVIIHFSFSLIEENPPLMLHAIRTGNFLKLD